MAFPTIPTAGAGTILGTLQANTTATRTFPAFSGLTYSTGDLLVAIAVAYQSSAAAGAVWSGWNNGFTERKDVGGGTSSMTVGVASKIADGTETGSLTVTQAATITGFAVLFLMAIHGAHATSAPEATALATGTTTAADPAALTPSWGAGDDLWIAVSGWGETSTTGGFVNATASPTNYGNDFIVNASGTKSVGNTGAGVGFRQLNATSEDAGTWTGIDTSNARNSALVIAIRPVPSQTVSIAPATETDAPGDLIQVHSLVPPSEADATAGLSITHPHRVSLTPAAETDVAVAQSVSHSHIITLTPAVEADAAQALSATKPIHVNLVTAVESDAAQALAAHKAAALTPAAEADTAVAPSTGSHQSVTLTPAVESDAPGSLVQVHSLTAATETDSAQALTTSGPPSTHVTIDPAGPMYGQPPLFDFIPTDVAQPLTAVKLVTITPAVESDSVVVLSIGSATHVNLTPAVEADAAVGLTVSKPIHKSLTPAAEADQAQALGHAKAVDLTPAAGNDVAQPASARKSVSMTAAGEADSAVSLSFTKTIYVTLTPASESDSALSTSVNRPHHATLIPAGESDVALTLTRQHPMLPRIDLPTAVVLSQLSVTSSVRATVTTTSVHAVQASASVEDYATAMVVDASGETTSSLRATMTTLPIRSTQAETTLDQYEDDTSIGAHQTSILLDA